MNHDGRESNSQPATRSDIPMITITQQMRKACPDPAKKYDFHARHPAPTRAAPASRVTNLSICIFPCSFSNYRFYITHCSVLCLNSR